MALIISGSLARDRIMTFDGEFENVILPDQIKNLSLSVLLSGLHESWGGVAGNIAYSLGLLKEQPVLLGSVGKDSETKSYLRRLAKIGADIDFMHWSELPTATFSVITDRHQRQFSGFYPGAMSDLPETALRQTIRELSKQQRWEARSSMVVVSPHDPARMATQVAECAKEHWRLIYDIGQQVAVVSPEDLRAGILAAEIVLVNEYELSLLIQKTGWSQDVITRQLPTLIVTLGERGCEVFADHGQITTHVPPIAGVTVVDPTGGGDAFRAGFFYAVMRDWPLVQAAQLGNTVAAYAIEHRGTQAHRFSLAQLQRRYANHYHEKITFLRRQSEA